MLSYAEPKTTKNFEEFMKSLYFPSPERIEEIEIPKMKFIAVSGSGSPESKNFQMAVQALYSVGYSIKMGLKFGKLDRPKGYFDFKMPPLEGLWWQEGSKTFNTDDKSKWLWQVMIMMPPFVDETMVQAAAWQVATKHPEIRYGLVKLIEMEEGRSVQALHVGPYSAEPETVDKIISYTKRNEFEINGHHHEIYMSDPRRVKEEKLKTVLRYPVK